MQRQEKMRMEIDLFAVSVLFGLFLFGQFEYKACSFP